MSNNTPKPAAGGKISTAIVVSLIWCLGIGVYLWSQREKPVVVSKPPEGKAPAAAAEPAVSNGANDSASSSQLKRPHPGHYAAPLPPAPLTYGQVDSPPAAPAAAGPPSSAGTVPVLVASGGNYAGTAGSSIRGKIVLKGTPPREIPIRFDEVCGKKHPDGDTTHRYVVAKDGGLADVVVYIAKGLKRRSLAVPGPMVLNQKDCLYEPLVSAVMIGQGVKIRNSDPVLHNVHALPRMDGNQEFNFAQPSQGMVDETTFMNKIKAKEVMVKIKCDVHDWMLAYVAVLDNPYFGVSDTNGNFTITNVPPGSYTIVATHLKAGSITNRVTMGGQQDGQINFVLNAK